MASEKPLKEEMKEVLMVEGKVSRQGEALGVNFFRHPLQIESTETLQLSSMYMAW